MLLTLSTLRRWLACGKLVPERIAGGGGQRRYSASQLMTQQPPYLQRKTVAYSRASCHDQKKIWNGSRKFFCYTALPEAGSTRSPAIGNGMNCHKKGLR